MLDMRRLSVHTQVSVSDFLTLFSARTHEGFFWSARPSWILLTGALTALTLSTILACVWPEGKTDGLPTVGLARKTYDDTYTLWPLWVWIFCVLWWFVQDGLKVGWRAQVHSVTMLACCSSIGHCEELAILLKQRCLI